MITVTSEVDEAIASINPRFCRMISIELDVPIYFTDSSAPIEWDSKTWENNAYITDLSDIKQASLTRNNSVSIGLSGVDQLMFGSFLNSNYLNKPVEIYICMLDNLDRMIPDPVKIHTGSISGVSLSNNPQSGKSSVAITSSGLFSDFERVNGRMSNSKSQNIYFPDDKGFEFSGQAPAVNLKWGSK